MTKRGAITQPLPPQAALPPSAPSPCTVAHLRPDVAACCCISMSRCRRQATSAGSFSSSLSSKSESDPHDLSSAPPLSAITARWASAVAL